MEPLNLLFVLGGSGLEFPEIVGQPFNLLAEKSSFVFNFGVLSLEFLVLSVQVINNIFVVTQFPACVHFKLLDNCNLLLSNLSPQVINVVFPRSDLLSQSLNLLRSNGDFVFVFVDFSL